MGAVLRDAGLNLVSYSGASAGSAMAASLFARNYRDVVRYFRSVTLRNPSNFHFRNLFLGARPFPHERIYRRAVRTYMDWRVFVESKERIAINALEVPHELYPTSFARARLLVRIVDAFRKEMKLYREGRYKSLLSECVRACGLVEKVFRNEDIDSPEHLEDIILASSSVPPMVKFQKVKGRYYLDGGITRNLPVALLENVDVAIGIYYNFWTRLQYEGVNVVDGGQEIEKMEKGKKAGPRVILVSPERDLPIQTWDYANPRGIELAYEAGLRAGEHLLPIVKKMR